MRHKSSVYPRHLVQARNGDLLVFAANGFFFASWLSRLPDVKKILDVSTGTLSLLLLSLAIGSLLGLPLSGRIANKLGSKNTVRLGASITCSGLIVAGLLIQPGQPILLIAVPLVLLGFGIGAWDVAQNLEGAAIEQEIKKAIMPWFHAAFSAGTVLGALIGSVITKLELPVGLHLSGASVITFAIILFGTTKFIADAVPVDSDHEVKLVKAASAWTEPRTLLIGILVLAAAFTEGTATDWIAIAFVDGHGTSTPQGVLGLSVFLLFMTAGRVLGTKALDTYGRVIVLRILLGATLIGCLLFVFGGPIGAYFGAALWGLGASLGFPVGMSAASDDPKRAALRISVVSTIGYTAFLAGPPVVGFLGEAVGILQALLIVGVISVLAFLAVPAAKPLEGSNLH